MVNETYDSDEARVEMMMKALDGYLSEDEQKSWEHFLSTDPELAADFSAMGQTARYMNAFRERQIHARYANKSPLKHHLLKAGLLCVLIGVSVAAGAMMTDLKLVGVTVGAGLCLVGAVVFFRAQVDR